MKPTRLTTLLILAAALALSGCSGKQNASDTQTSADQPTAEAAITQEASSSPQKWPVQFKEWGIPTLDDAVIDATEDRSATQEGMTQGVNIVVNLSHVSQEGYDSYLRTLTEAGFTASGSVPGAFSVLEKPIDGGVLKMTLALDDGKATVIANNSAVASAKAAQAGGDVKWPDAAKAIPAFTKGKYIETVDMGGGMFNLTYADVTDADLESYRAALKSAGFERMDSDTENYGRMEGSAIYSVGISPAGSRFQLVVAVGTL